MTTEEFIELTQAAWPRDVSPSSQAWFTDKLRETLNRLGKQETIKTELYEACKKIDHFFNESVGQVTTEKQAFDAYHNSGTSDRVKAALAKVEEKQK